VHSETHCNRRERSGSVQPRTGSVLSGLPELIRDKMYVGTLVESAWFRCLKLVYDESLSNFAFDFNLRRYNKCSE